MKKNYIIAAFVSMVSIVQCSSEKKVAYNIDPSLPEPKKAELRANLEKGRLLFKQHCSECHGIYQKGKKGIPDFTSQEIKDYSVAYKALDKRNHAVAKKLLPEEMSMIITFLQLRKIDSIPAHRH